MVFRTATHMVSVPSDKRSVNVSQIAATFHGIRPPCRCPDLIDCPGPDAVWRPTYNDSRIVLPMICQILARIVSVNDFWLPSSAPGTSLGSFVFPEKFSFYMCRIVTHCVAKSCTTTAYR